VVVKAIAFCPFLPLAQQKTRHQGGPVVQVMRRGLRVGVLPEPFIGQVIADCAAQGGVRTACTVQ